MAFSFRSGEPLDDGVRRIAGAQLTNAVAELQGRKSDDVREVVHSVRKRGKRVRALLRLVRPGLGKEYGRANAAVRDAGLLLAPIRDAHALLGTFDALVAGRGADRTGIGLLGVRVGLALRAREATARVGRGDPAIDEAIGLLESARHRIGRWSLDDGFSALAPGLGATYRRGRLGFHGVAEAPSPEVLHEWRKGAKHLWHQTQLLTASAPSILDPLGVSLKALADTLGDDHDLVVLEGILRADPDAFGGPHEVAAAIDLGDRRRTDLESRAVGLGARLYAEKANVFVDRIARYWDAWQDYGDEQVAGEIATVAPPDDDLGAWPRDVLEALARSAGIPECSAMSRDDLLGSLRALAVTPGPTDR